MKYWFRINVPDPILQYTFNSPVMLTQGVPIVPIATLELVACDKFKNF